VRSCAARRTAAVPRSTAAAAPCPVGYVDELDCQDAGEKSVGVRALVVRRPRSACDRMRVHSMHIAFPRPRSRALMLAIAMVVNGDAGDASDATGASDAGGLCNRAGMLRRSPRLQARLRVSLRLPDRVRLQVAMPNAARASVSASLASGIVRRPTQRLFELHTASAKRSCARRITARR